MGIIGDLGLSLESGTPAVFTLDPDPLDLGTDASATAELSASRLAGVRVSLDGAIADVASISTPLGWDGGGCGDGVGEVLSITVTRTGGNSRQIYSGEIVIEDDTGAETRFDVSLEVPSSLSEIAQTQGWDFIWDMATAGTSQPNVGSGAATALMLSQARATTTQAGALGCFPLTSSTSHEAYSAAGIAMGSGAKSVVVCVEITSLVALRGIWGGGLFADSNNFGFIAINSTATSFVFQDANLNVVCTLAPASTGVWLFGVSSDSAGAITAWARKVGAARQDSSGTRGTTSGGASVQTLGGNLTNYFSATGNYFFAALRTSTSMTAAEFGALFSALS